MASIPVVCDSCGRLFLATRLIGGPGSARITFINTRVRGCPYCGGTGHIPDGVYELAQGVVRYLGDAGLSSVELRTLQTVLTQATQDNTAPDDVAAKVRDRVPNAVGLLTFLKSPSGVALAAWLTFLVVLIGVLIAHADAQLTPAEIEQIIGEALSHDTDAPPATTPSAAAPLTQAIPSRNARCPCGSGKTYKNCHGRRS
jgi:SEC-C motif